MLPNGNAPAALREPNSGKVIRVSVQGCKGEQAMVNCGMYVVKFSSAEDFTAGVNSEQLTTHNVAEG